MRFLQEFHKRLVDILGRGEPEPVNPVLAQEVLDLRQAGVARAALEPEVTVEPLFLRHRAREADADLKDDAGFLRVHVGRTEVLDDRVEPIEQLANDRRLACEMILESIAAARMPDVRRHEPVSAGRALPQPACR